MGSTSRQTLLLVLFLIAVPLLTLSASFQNLRRPINLQMTPIFRPSTDPNYLELPLYEDDHGTIYTNVTWKNASHPYFPGNTNESAAHLITHNNSDDNDDDYPVGKMVLSLYSKETFLTLDCDNFIPYFCDLYDCNIGDFKPAQTSYLYQGMNVSGGAATIGMASPAFEVCGYPIVYADTCGTNFPLDISGFLGLGHTINAMFEVNKNFSIFLSNGEDGVSSTLYAGATGNPDRIDHTQNYIFVGETDSNWMIPITRIEARSKEEESLVGGIQLTSEHFILFDLNTDIIGLPQELFNNVIVTLSACGLECNITSYRPSCSYDGDINALPTLYLVNEGGFENKLEIEPAVYLKRNDDGNQSSYTLEFGVASVNGTGPLLIDPVYINAIILGRSFLTFYYVHFSTSLYNENTFVTIQHANHVMPTGNKSNLELIIIAGIVSLTAVTIIGCIFFCVKKRRDRRRKAEKEEESTEAIQKTKNTWFTNCSITHSMVKQPLLNSTLDFRPDFLEPVSPKAQGNVWSSNKLQTPQNNNEIDAHTYGKQKFNELYESNHSTYSLKDNLFNGDGDD